jgi:hypothetical protein
LDEDQRTVVLTTLPDASYAVALACAALPTERLVGALIFTDATTAVPLPTFRFAVALCPSDDAVMTVVPAETPVTIPEVDTVATVGRELLKATDLPVRRLPDASYSLTDDSLVSPPPMLSRESVRTTRATGAGGGVAMVIEAAPLTPPLVAMIETLPGANAVTRPDSDTVASVGSLLLQVIEAPEIGAPLTSRAMATACVDCPTFRVDELTVTSTRFTVGPLVAWTVIEAEALRP